MQSRDSVGTCQGNELTRSSSGIIRPQSSQIAEPLRIDPGGGAGKISTCSSVGLSLKNE